MPGLLGIGTGLTGFMNGYAQAQQALGQKQLLQQLLARNQRQSQAQELEGQALTAGGLPGFSGGIGTGLAGGFAPQPAQPPMPGQPSVPSAPTTPIQPSPQPAPAPAASAPPPMQGSTSSDDLGADEQGPDPTAVVARDAAAEPPVATPPAAAPEAADPAPSVPTSPSGQVQVVNPTGSGGTMDLAHFLNQHTDPQAIAARIKELRPNADPGAVAMATENLYKLSQNGDKMQQVQMAYMLKYLGLNAQIANHEQTHEDRVRGQDITSADRNRAISSTDTRAQNREAGTQGRFDVAEARRSASALDRKLYQGQQQALAEEREARQSGNAVSAQAARRKSQQLQAIRAQISALSAKANGPAGTFTKDDAAALTTLQKQAAALGVAEGP